MNWLLLKGSIKIDQFAPNTRLLRRESTPYCKHQSLGQRITCSAIFPHLFVAQLRLWWGAAGCVGTRAGLTLHTSDRSMGSEAGTWGLKVSVEFGLCSPTSAWSPVPDVTVWRQLRGKHVGSWASQDVALLTYSVIHSFTLRQWVESFRELSAGLSPRSAPASSRNSESSQSNHSRAMWRRQVAFPLQMSVSSSLEWDCSGYFTRGRYWCFEAPPLSGVLSRF